MGFTAKAKSSSSSEGWGMGFFLVFFPEENPILNKKKTNLLSPPSSSSATTINTLLSRTNSTHLLTKAQSTISICALLLFITLLLFTLSTFEPTSTTTAAAATSRRHLSPIEYKPTKNSPWSIKFLKHNSNFNPKISPISPSSPALQGMGILYRRGTKAMNDLIVSQLTESVTSHEFRLFVRVLFRSNLNSKSDLAFIFPSSQFPFDTIIREENESFMKLIHRYKEFNGTSLNSVASFDVIQFVKSSKNEKEWVEPIWGKRIRSNYSEESDTELTRLSYGSVVSFEVDELDPENSLAGFLDHVPMSLRRWACYPMLLGRVRRKFKHVTLVDVKDVLLLGDPLGRVRNQSPESVYLTTLTQHMPSKHSKKNSEKTRSQKLFNPGIMMGGARGIRRLSNAMLTEIVRAAMQHKRKNSVSESVVLSQLVRNEFILKNVNLVTLTESIPGLSSLNSASSLDLSSYAVDRRGNSNMDIEAAIMKHICSFPLDSSVYRDC